MHEDMDTINAFRSAWPAVPFSVDGCGLIIRPGDEVEGWKDEHLPATGIVESIHDRGEAQSPIVIVRLSDDRPAAESIVLLKRTDDHARSLIGKPLWSWA